MPSSHPSRHPHDSFAPIPQQPPPIVERRRRSRVHSTTQGWLIPDTGDPLEPWEVRVNDISRIGVGFETTEKMTRGALCRIRIGRGPMRLARRIRVVTCRPGPDGHYVVGSEFVAQNPQGN
jgi:hypothetical protein